MPKVASNSLSKLCFSRFHCGRYRGNPYFREEKFEFESETNTLIFDIDFFLLFMA